jgi:hypothetical protein
MAEVFQVKAIKAKPMRLKEVRLELLNALRAEGKENEKLLEQTWATWKGDKPKAETLIGLTTKDASVLTGPNGSEDALNKFKWLDEGTCVRYATMSQDWKSKTTPGKLKSGRGRGRMLFVNKRRPRPGIKARGWTELIQKRRRRPFTNAMIKAKNRGLDKLYG